MHWASGLDLLGWPSWANLALGMEESSARSQRVHLWSGIPTQPDGGECVPTWPVWCLGVVLIENRELHCQLTSLEPPALEGLTARPCESDPKQQAGIFLLPPRKGLGSAVKTETRSRVLTFAGHVLEAEGSCLP